MEGVRGMGYLSIRACERVLGCGLWVGEKAYIYALSGVRGEEGERRRGKGTVAGKGELAGRGGGERGRKG